jgi:O-antigen/teichoic acid export membrane protein
MTVTAEPCTAEPCDPQEKLVNSTVAEQEGLAEAAKARSLLRAVLVRGASTVFIIQVVGTGATYLSNVAFARWAGAAEYGVYAYAFGWPKLISAFCVLGFTTAVLRFIPEYVHQQNWPRLRGLLLHSQATTFGAGAICGLAMAAVVFFTGSLSTKSSLLVAAILIPLLAFTTLQSQVLRGFQFVTAAYTPGAVLRPILVCLLVYIGYRSAGHLSGKTILQATCVAICIEILLQTVLLRVQIPPLGTPKFEFDLKLWWGLAGPLVVITALQLLYQTDLLLVGMLRGPYDAGIYNAASRTATLPSYFLIALNGISAPLISRLHVAGDHRGMRTLVRTTTHGAFWPALIMAICMAIFARPLMLAFGRDFAASQPAFLILLIGQLVTAMAGSASFLLLLTGHQNQTMKVYAASVVISLALNFALIPAWGPVGAAIASVVTTVFWNIALVIIVKRRLNVVSLPLP